jgi:hypothetical protein
MPTVTVADRVANYERNSRRHSFISIAPNGWRYGGDWEIGNSYRRKVPYPGAYQGDLLRRIAALFPDKQRVLHLFSGMVDLSVLPGDTLDTRPELAPTWCVDAETCEGVPLEVYDLVVADPPYDLEAAAKYGTPMPSRNKVMLNALPRLSSGAHVVWLDIRKPMWNKEVFTIEGSIGVTGSTNHRSRHLWIWRRR